MSTFFVQFGDYKKIMSSVSVKSSVQYSNKMKILSFIFALTISFSALPKALARANQDKAGGNGVMVYDQKSAPFKICIDDSDCQKIGEGDKFACFQVWI